MLDLKDLEAIKIIIKEEISGLDCRITGLEGRFTGLEGRFTGLEGEIKDLKLQQQKDTAELKIMDEIIFDEVERVHEILIKRTDDLRAKIG